jgi:superfamily I DNA and/or RNA helicase
VVFAGDHLQMREKVYSSEAKEMNFDVSIVERLHRHYSKNHQLGSFEPVVRLIVNYRNKKEITDFMSEMFYDNKLLSESQQESVVPPVNFFEACGEEQQDEESTSWYNVAEINEVTDRVHQLSQHWPREWGDRDNRQILVTAAYFEQVSNKTLEDLQQYSL